MSSEAFAYRSRGQRQLLHSLVVLLTIMIMLPFVWLLVMSFKTNEDIFAFPPKLFFTPTLDNYRALWSPARFRNPS